MIFVLYSVKRNKYKVINHIMSLNNKIFENKSNSIKYIEMMLINYKLRKTRSKRHYVKKSKQKLQMHKNI